VLTYLTPTRLSPDCADTVEVDEKGVWVSSDWSVVSMSRETAIKLHDAIGVWLTETRPA
jgi:hypothetical protein